MAQEEQAKLYGQIVARAWQDEDFKRQLLTDTEGALAEMGVEVPSGHEVRVVEDTERVRHLVIPPGPSEELSEEQLDQVAGGIGRIDTDINYEFYNPDNCYCRGDRPGGW